LRRVILRRPGSGPRVALQKRPRRLRGRDDLLQWRSWPVAPLWAEVEALGGFAVLDGIGRWSSSGCWRPGFPACGWRRLRDAGKYRGQRPSGLVDPRPQEPPVPPRCQRLFLRVHGGNQLLEQIADLSGPVASLVVGGALGQQLPTAHEVDQGGPQWWPRQGPLARIFRGQHG